MNEEIIDILFNQKEMKNAFFGHDQLLMDLKLTQMDMNRLNGKKNEE